MNNPKEDETEKLHFIKYISNDIEKSTPYDPMVTYECGL